LEALDRRLRVVADDGLRQLEDVGLDRAAHEGAHVGSGHARAGGERTELRELLIDAFAVRADGGAEIVDRLRRELDAKERGPRGDPASELARTEPRDVLDPPARRLD